MGVPTDESGTEMVASKLKVQADKKRNQVYLLISDQDNEARVEQIVLTPQLAQRLGEELFKAGRITDVGDPAYGKKP